MTDIRGLTYQTLIELTTNIESQEWRRRQNGIVGYPENPRAGSTDDVEAFFAMTRSRLGGAFTLQDFKEHFRKLVRYYDLKSFQSI